MIVFLEFVSGGEGGVNTQDTLLVTALPATRTCKKQPGGVTWLDQSYVEDLLDKAVVGSDLIHGARRVLYTDDVHWHEIVRHSAPEHLAILFAYLEYFRPQPVSNIVVKHNDESTLICTKRMKH